MKPPIKVNIEYIHVRRQIVGQVIVRKSTDDEIILSLLQSDANVDFDENLRQLEFFRRENERLRSELNAHKTEINVLRSERDSLMNTISKLDTELTQAECQRFSRQQQPRKK